MRRVVMMTSIGSIWLVFLTDSPTGADITDQQRLLLLLLLHWWLSILPSASLSASSQDSPIPSTIIFVNCCPTNYPISGVMILR